MFSLEAPDFLLTITPLQRMVEQPMQPYMDWIRCHVSLVVPGFEANIEWMVMASELQEFKEDITTLQAAHAAGSQAVLESQERGFRLSVEMTDDRGHGLGKYSVQESPPHGAVLSGQFGFDQTYLAGIADGVSQLLSAT